MFLHKQELHRVRAPPPLFMTMGLITTEMGVHIHLARGGMISGTIILGSKVLLTIVTINLLRDGEIRPNYVISRNSLQLVGKRSGRHKDRIDCIGATHFT